MVTAGSTQHLLHPESKPSTPKRLQATTGGASKQEILWQLEEALGELQGAMHARDGLRLQTAIRMLVKYMASIPNDSQQLQKVKLV